MTLRGILAAEIDAWQRLGHPALLQRFVLRNGTAGTWQPLPDGMQMGEQKQCFMNAAQLTLHAGLRYVEGFCYVARLPIPIHHAWNLDEDGRVIDTTLRDGAGTQYFGVEFDAATLADELLRNRIYGLLDVRGVNVALINALDPDLVRQVTSKYASATA